MATKFRTLLPPVATPAEQAQEQAGTELIQAIPLPVREIKRINDCPLALLPWLAWEYRVDTWNNDWTEDEKRDALRRAPFVHRHRGTKGAVLRALENAPFKISLVEWFEQTPRGEPYTFLLRAIQAGLPVTRQDMHDLKAAVIRTKSLRSWFRVQMLGEVNGAAWLAGWMKSTEHTISGGGLQCYAVKVNGWQTTDFRPVTSFAGASYTLMIQGGTGAVKWQVEKGKARVDSRGTVTITGPGMVVVTATDTGGHTFTHAIAPRLWLEPDTGTGIADAQAVASWLAGTGARLPVPDELALSVSHFRGNGALWNEWGDMQVWGWRTEPWLTAALSATDAAVLHITGTDTPRMTVLHLPDNTRCARCRVTDYYS